MTSTAEPIRGKVARLLTSRQLALNIGKDHGVAVGMRFDVLDPKGENIKDPETEQVLGSVCRPKVRVKVVEVQDRLSVAQTYKTRKVNVGGQGIGSLEGFAKLFVPPQWVTRYETLKTEEKTWEDLDESESYVKTGDPVVQVIEEPGQEEAEAS
jgi:hypothetical protein